jgi:glycosyltransferase involved in cell wall biosynthesis
MTDAVTPSPELPWPVMVLAHNEERHIEACLDSIVNSGCKHPLEVYVMANACTDATEAIVRAYGTRHPQVKLVSIALGDKCNAWNIFIHETVPAHCPDRTTYFFMDGDARSVAGSFDAMHAALQRESHAHAASAPPASGRNAAKDRNELLSERGLVANLYALRAEFVRRLIRQGVRLPLKLEGDDGLLGALVKWDLDPKNNGFDHQRIVPCADAGFMFEPFSPFAWSTWGTYWKRAVRYGRRRYEFVILGRRLKASGVGALPRDITEIYRDANDLTLTRDGLYTLPNWVALRQMRKIAAQQASR